MVSLTDFMRSFLFGPVYHSDRAVDISVVSPRARVLERMTETLGSSDVRIFRAEHYLARSLPITIGGLSSPLQSVGSLLDYLADVCDELDAPLTSIQIVPVTHLGKSAYSVAGYCYYRDVATRDESVVRVGLTPVSN